jgi:cytochrome b pre-mRNA-processing protein 3
VFDAMFSDMDVNLREMGVGDLVVGKRVKRMWEAFHGRAAAYEAAVDASDRAALAEALTRNIWRGEAQPNSAQALADHVLAVAASLRAQPIAALKRGRADFPALVPA